MISKNQHTLVCNNQHNFQIQAHKYLNPKMLLLLLCLCVVPCSFAALTIRGQVFGQNETGGKQPIPGAHVIVSGKKGVTITDDTGSFQLHTDSHFPITLIASFAGYKADTLQLYDADFTDIQFVLKQQNVLNKVTVTASNHSVQLSQASVLKTENINKIGLVKLACCNLSESFENSATVTVGYTDAVSGAKKVQMLGLSGIYTQLQAENIPTLRGLASTYGWSYIPGSWLESVQISKGASSVVNGYESVVGQINVEFKKPDVSEPLFINVYGNQFGCFEANATTSTQVAKNLWTGLLVSGTWDKNAHDYNGDGLLDMPQTQTVNVYNRWFWLNPNGIQSRTGIKFLYDDRKGGHDSKHLTGGTGAHYITDIVNRNFTLENKTGIPIRSDNNQSVALVSSLSHYEQNSEFGLKTFNGVQNSLLVNALFSGTLGDEHIHKYTLGASFMYDNYKLAYQDQLVFNQTSLTQLNRVESVPGIFAEYSYTHSDHISVILGNRIDYNSRYGWLYTPRANIRYGVTKNIVLRASVGKGYRAPNAISDNIGILASSRKLQVDDIASLDIERAWNYGANLSYTIPYRGNKKITLSLDYFHTQFLNQAVVDFERNSNSVYFYNVQGGSFADAVQLDVAAPLFTGFDVFAALRFNNTRMTYEDGSSRYQVEKPLMPRYRGLLNLSYATKFRKWVFDFTSQLNGPSRIPWLNGYNSERKESPVYPLFFAQITKNTKRVDIYAGAENILNYTQQHPVINASNPFSQGFESAFIWGPVIGRKIYIGARIRIGKL